MQRTRNIDRWLATWEAINPTKLAGIKDTDALAPFLKSANTFWKGSDVHDTENLGYTYPDIEKGNPEVTRQKFNKLEAWSIPDMPEAIDFKNWIPPDHPKEREPLDLSTAWVYSDGKIGYRKLSPPSQKKGNSIKPTASHRQAAAPIVTPEMSSRVPAPAADQAPMGIPATVSSSATPKVGQWYVDMEVER
jgi:hypothetical protein